MFKKRCKKSDEVIVAKKYVKAYGAKDRNTLTFLDGKHKRSNETKKNYSQITIMGTKQQDMKSLNLNTFKLYNLKSLMWGAVCGKSARTVLGRSEYPFYSYIIREEKAYS